MTARISGGFQRFESGIREIDGNDSGIYEGRTRVVLVGCILTREATDFR